MSPQEPENDRDDIPTPALSGFPEDAALTDAQKRQAIAAYHATVTFADYQVGLLLDALKELNLDDSTVVMLVSDHGFHLGEHGGSWRKHTQFEETTRVPLIVRTPDAPRGRSTQALVELVDLYPTLAELCGLPVPPDLEGISFCPLLKDPERAWKTAAFSEAKRGGAHGRTIRTASYRYTEWTPLDGEGDVQYELYNLDNDPHEFHNLALDPKHRPLREELASKLKAGWRAALPSSGILDPSPS